MKKLLSADYLIIRNGYAKLLVLFLLFIAAITLKDYGMSWDEMAQNEIGRKAYEYVTGENEDYRTFINNDYGVAFEMPVVYIQDKIIKTNPAKDYFKHAMVHLVFLTGLYALYLVVKRLFGSYKWGLAAMVCMVISPRIYGDSFHNSKDIVLLAFWIVSFYTLIRALDKRTYWAWILHGISTALLINIRILGVLMIAVTVFVLLLDIITDPTKWKVYLVYFLVFMALLSIVLVITWPLLWQNPLQNIVQAFNNMSHFRWDSSVLYRTGMIPATLLPWHYLPTWISITTPELFLVGFGVGVCMLVYQFVKNPLSFIQNTNNRMLAIAAGTVIAPIAAIVLLHSVLYDAWRQVFFIYPFLIITVLFAAKQVYDYITLQYPSHKKNVLIAYGVLLLPYVVQTVTLYPHENVYFNQLVSHKEGSLLATYEQDYWGTAAKQGWDYLLKQYPTDTLKVYPWVQPMMDNLELFPMEDQKRVKMITDPAIITQADYFMTNYRWAFDKHPPNIPLGEKIFTIKKQNSEIFAIYKIKK